MRAGETDACGAFPASSSSLALTADSGTLAAVRDGFSGAGDPCIAVDEPASVFACTGGEDRSGVDSALDAGWFVATLAGADDSGIGAACIGFCAADVSGEPWIFVHPRYPLAA